MYFPLKQSRLEKRLPWKNHLYKKQSLEYTSNISRQSTSKYKHL